MARLSEWEGETMDARKQVATAYDLGCTIQIGAIILREFLMQLQAGMNAAIARHLEYKGGLVQTPVQTTAEPQGDIPKWAYCKIANGSF